MRLKNLALALGLATFGWMMVAPPAQAQLGDRYNGRRYYSGGNRDEVRRRMILRERLLDLGDRVRLAERQRALSRHDASELYEDLDDVRDFLMDDRHLTDSEYDRRMDDLDDVEEEFRENARHNYRQFPRRYERTYGREGRYSRRYTERYGDPRYNDRYYNGRYNDRYDDRYYRR